MDLTPPESSSSRSPSPDPVTFDADTGNTELLLSADILKEEKRLEKENLLQQRKLERERANAQVKENNYKQLMELLKRSTFYSDHVRMKAKKFMENEDKKRKRGDPKTEVHKKTKIERQLLEQQALQELDGKVEEVEDGNIQDEYEEGFTTYRNSLGITVDSRQPLYLEGAALRDYQMKGFQWLKLLYETGMNGILADEMGLGKTIQVISLLCHLYEKGVTGPFLVVAPLSTLPNWINEFESFCPQIPVILYHGDMEKRKQLRNKISKTHSLGSKQVFPVIITSYQVPITDDSYLGLFGWKYIIVDEGHRIKNHKSQLSRKLRSFSSINRLLLTGTPIHNDLTELWALLNFLLPEMFDSLDAFQAWFSVEKMESASSAKEVIEQEQKDEILKKLHEILSPFFLRRVKSEVNLNLPPKRLHSLFCNMTPVQKELYSGILDTSIQFLRAPKEDVIIPDNPDGTKSKRWSKLRNNLTRHPSLIAESCLKFRDSFVKEINGETYAFNFKLNNPMMAMRKVVNHPYLIQRPTYLGTNIPREELNELIAASGKFTVFDKLMRNLLKENHKVLVFSTFTCMLDIIEDYFEMNGTKYVRLDGSSKIEERRQSIYEFNSSPDISVFLISTRAGGLGLNLTAADTVIIYDSDWNPQVDLQAQDRCHRIGQTKPVIVYRLVTKNTIDEKIVSRAHAKRKLERIVIQEGGFNSSGSGKSIDLEVLKALLEEDYKREGEDITHNDEQFSDEQWANFLRRDF